MKVLGLFIVLALSIGAGFLYVKTTGFDAQGLPQSYKVMDELETKGIYGQQDFDIKDLDGNQMKLSDFKDKILILSFWATWCEPCVEEFPSFIKLMDAYPDKVVVLAISHDYEAADVKEFVGAFKGYRKNLILTMDEGKALSKAFGVDKLPEGFIFGRDGKLLKKIIGIQDWASPNALEYFNKL